MSTTEKKKRVNILKFAECGEGEVWLQHSAKGKSPDAEGAGWYRPHSSVIWAKAGRDAEWRQTPYTSLRRAMDDLLGGPRLAADAVEMLVSGRRIAERSAAADRMVAAGTAIRTGEGR